MNKLARHLDQSVRYGLNHCGNNVVYLYDNPIIMSDILQRVKDAIFTAFSDIAADDLHRFRQLLDDHVKTAENDSEGWAPDAAIIIHVEYIGLPGPCTCSPVLIEKWLSISDILQDHYCEFINDAVVAVYKRMK